MITIVNYGSGNINAITNIFDIQKIPYSVASTPSQLDIAKKIILPGVGSFDHCMKKLNQSGLIESLSRKVLQEKIPVLGICIGLHLMAIKSEEGIMNGLGWINGIVRRFDESQLKEMPKIPHMGWNSISVKSSKHLFKGIDPERGFYFIHSYYIDIADANEVMTMTNYGNDFVSRVN